MPELFLGALGVVLLLLFLQKLQHAETKLLIKTLKWTFVGLLGMATVYLTLVGSLLYVAGILGLFALLLKDEVRKWVTKKPSLRFLKSPMTKQTAAKLLKVKRGATTQEIEDAFLKIHPQDTTHRDLLYQARDILLNKNNES